MSPRLLFLLTTHASFVRDRDRFDARLAATRMGLRAPVTLHVAPDPVVVLPVDA
jgi:hypothetical protein